MNMEPVTEQAQSTAFDEKIQSISGRLQQFVQTELNKAPQIRSLQDCHKRIDLFLDWIMTFIDYTEQQDIFTYSGDIYDLKRGDVVLIDLGFNVGKELGGERPAIVLRHSKQNVDQVMVLPLSTQKPKNMSDPIYVEIPKIPGLTGYRNDNDPKDPDNGKHWANILSIRNISKIRIKYPPEKLQIKTGKILDIISAAIVTHIALRGKKRTK